MTPIERHSLHDAVTARIRDMIVEARQRHRDAMVRAVFDCGKDPGIALGALRHGLAAIRVRAAADTMARLADIAGQAGAEIEDGTNSGPVLDLLDVDDPDTAVRAWLAGTAGTKADGG